MFVNLAEHPLPPIFGVQQEPLGATAELRVLFENSNHPIAVRLPDAVYLAGRYHALSKTAENTETILYADWHYSHSAVLTCRRVGAGNVACTLCRIIPIPTCNAFYSGCFISLQAVG